MAMKYCCERMKLDLNQKCDMHRNRLDCPDNLVHYSHTLREYGLIIHDGGRSVVRIAFCPWCGKKLARARERMADQRGQRVRRESA
jgi:hypothetical protein